MMGIWELCVVEMFGGILEIGRKKGDESSWVHGLRIDIE